VPTDNPVATHYGVDQGYPAWTDRIAWHRVIDMSAYGVDGQSDFEKFEAARDELHAQGGGVLYYPAGDYDFADAPMDGPDGRGLMLKSGVVIRGEAPDGVDRDASDGTLKLGTRFWFGFTERVGTGVTPIGHTPRDWGFVGLEPDVANGESLKDVTRVGVVWIHMIGGSVFWGFELDWDGATTYAASGAWKSAVVKPAWQGRVADGRFPMDYFAGSAGARSYVGAGSGRLVFGCVLEDSAPVNDVVMENRVDKNFGPDGYFMQKFGARVQIYGSDVCVANNLLPSSTRGFLYEQTVGDNPQQSENPSAWIAATRTLYYDYGYISGIDINKEFLNPFVNKAAGYFEPHVVVRDNFVYNHGRKGFNISGRWVEIRNNTNQRDYLGTSVPADSGPASGATYYLTLDGYVQAKPGGSGSISDTLSRAFDLGGGPLWVHDNRYGGVWGSTHSLGNDGEGILCQAHGGTEVYSWAVTYNDGQGAYMAGYDVNQYGALWGWNRTSEVGSKKAGTLYDATIVGNHATVQVTGSVVAMTSNAGDPVTMPTGVSATVIDDVVEVAWTDTSTNESGFRVERSADEGPWQVVAYRPRREFGHPENPAAWRDISAPRAVDLRYRIVPTNFDDTAVAASEASASVQLEAMEVSGRVAVNYSELIESDVSWESGYQQRVALLINGQNWTNSSGAGDPDSGKRDWPALLAQMWKSRGDAAQLNAYINGGKVGSVNGGNTLMFSPYAGTFYKAFSVPGYNKYYFMFRDYSDSVFIPEAQANEARNINWDYLTREDNRMDPIYGQTEFNSENFNWMARLGGLQWAYELPDTDLGTYQYNLQAGQPKGMARAYFSGYMDNWTRALFNTGRVEWNSHIYWGYTFQPVITLYDHPPLDISQPDPAYRDKVKLQARAGADWMLLEAALHYLDGFVGGPESRAKNSPQTPFSGSVWPYAYLYFADAENHPTFSPSAAAAVMDKNTIGWFPWSDYRPLRVIRAIANREFALPVEIQSAKPFYHLDHDNYAAWSGEGSYTEWKANKLAAEQAQRTGFRYEFETIHMDTHYLLASVASHRPNGSIGTFSEHNLHRLMVKGSDNGAIQVVGNTGRYSTPAGRDPYEQIAQYANVMMRLIKSPTSTGNKLWFAIPNEAASAVDVDRVYVDMGQGVYVAIVPYGNSTLVQAAYGTSHRKYTWEFAADTLGALAMEVGTQADHGDFDGFRAAVAARVLTSPAPSQVEYTSSAGRVLRMEWTGVVNDYPMTENGGRILAVGGTIPRTWRDGVEVNYDTWNSYEVVSGESIVRQEWGSGLLTLSAGGETVQIEVDPVTADVQYYSGGGAPEPDPYRDWSKLHFTNLERGAGLAAPDEDPDSDGLSNRAEYAWGLDPRVVDAGLARPAVEMDNTVNGLVMSLVYRYNRGATDLEWIIEMSAGADAPGIWKRAEGVMTRSGGVATDGGELRTVEIPLAGDAPVFVRVRAQPRPR